MSLTWDPIVARLVTLKQHLKWEEYGPEEGGIGIRVPGDAQL